MTWIYTAPDPPGSSPDVKFMVESWVDPNLRRGAGDFMPWFSSSFREVWLGQTTTGCFHKESSQFSFASLNLWKFCSSISKERWTQLLSTSTWFGRRDLIFVKCEVHSVRIKLVPKLDHFVHLGSCTRTVVHLAEDVPMDGPCFSMCMAFQMEVSHGFYMFLLHTIQLVG